MKLLQKIHIRKFASHQLKAKEEERHCIIVKKKVFRNLHCT